MTADPAGEGPIRVGLFGRLGAWHSYRWLSPLFGLVFWMMSPWTLVAPWMLDEVITVNVVVALAWGIPAWRMGVIVDRKGVRLVGVVFTKRLWWHEIESARIQRIGIEPRLKVTLADGTEEWAPGFRIPYAQADSHADGWRSTDMFQAAQLITAEAERRREEAGPPGGALVPVPRRSLVTASAA